MSVLDKVRRWIDGDTAESVLEEAARDAQVQPRSQAEEFIVKLARAVEEVMQREMVPLPQGSTLIPTEYIIFLSEQDDKEWQGVKRRGLEQGLYHVLSERAKEISGKKKLETQSFAVELRVDGTLEKGDIRVQHTWDDGSSGKTGVLARPKPQPAPQVQPPAPPKIANPVAPSPAFTPQPSAPAYQPPPTAPSTGAYQYTPPPTDEESEEMTRVNRRSPELYRLEIWRGGVRQNVIPVGQTEIGIGRGSRSKPVDVTLPGDPEISRRHVTLIRDTNGAFWIVSEGRNSTLVANREIPNGQRVQISPGDTIGICSYLLRIQPR